MTRYVVIGAGAVGAVLAAQLHEAGTPVVLVARGANLAALRSGGLRLRRPHETAVVRVPLASGPGDVDLTGDDVLVLATKAQDAEAALRAWSWRPVAGGGTAADLPLVTLQNGISTEDAALRRSSAVYGASIWIAASHLVPGEVVSPSWPVVGFVWIGRHPGGRDERQEAIAADLRRAALRTWSVDDVARWKAAKLLGNVTNALDLFDGDADELAEAGRLLVAEARAVLAAAGLHPADPAEVGVAPGDLVVEAVPGHVGGRRSTWQSFARGASSEVDHLNGDVVQLGRRHGVPTPSNQLVQRLLGTAGAGDGDPGPGTSGLRVAQLLTALART